jgi:hypothetical protein
VDVSDEGTGTRGTSACGVTDRETTSWPPSAEPVHTWEEPDPVTVEDPETLPHVVPVGPVTFTPTRVAVSPTVAVPLRARVMTAEQVTADPPSGCTTEFRAASRAPAFMLICWAKTTP